MPIKPLRKPAWRRQYSRPPFDGAPHDQHRAARRIGAGWRPSDVSRLLGCDPRLMHELLREPEFVRMLKGYRDLVHGDPAERLKHLVQMSMLLLEEAVFEGDRDVALFIKREDEAGRNPAETLAKRMLAGLQQEKRLGAFIADASDTGTEWPDPEPSPRSSPPPVDPATRRVHRATAKLRAGLADEHGVLVEGDEINGPPPSRAPRRHDHLLVELPAAATAIGRFLPPVAIDTRHWAWPEGP